MLLRLIILKKLLVAVLLLTVAVLALVGSYRYDQLPELLQECTDNDHALLAAVVGRGLQDGQTRLLLTALVTGRLWRADCRCRHRHLAEAALGRVAALGVLLRRCRWSCTKSQQNPTA